MNNRQTTIACGTLALLCGSIHAQDILFEVHSPGLQPVALGDWNGDGLRDFATNGVGTSGTVRVRSGRDGSELHAFGAPPQGDPGWFGRTIANVGDLDGDGEDDLAIGDSYSAALGGYIQLRSSNAGALIRTLDNASAGGNYGIQLGPAGDLDDDGFADVLVGNPYFHPGGFVEVRSGLDGSSLRSWMGSQLGRNNLGTDLLHVDDISGDGVDDYLISDSAQPSQYFSGVVLALSGADGSVLYTLGGGFSTGEGYGAVLHRLSDLDGDGLDDVLVHDDGRGNGSPLIEFRSSGTGALLNQLESDLGGAYLHCTFGLFAADVSQSVAGGGGPAVALGIPGCTFPTQTGGILIVVNPLTGEVLSELRGEPQQGLGFFPVVLEDRTGDGHPELLYCSFDYDSANNRTTLVDIACGRVRRVCQSAPNSLGPNTRGYIHATDTSSVSANQFQLGALGVAGLGPGLYIAGPNPNSLPFGDGTLCLASPISRLMPAGQGPELGQLVPVDLSAGIPGHGSVLPGSSLYFQLWYRDTTPAGFNLTDAILVTFCR